MPTDREPGPLSDHGEHEPPDATRMRELLEKARLVSRLIVERVNRVQAGERAEGRAEEPDKPRPPAPPE